MAQQHPSNSGIESLKQVIYGLERQLFATENRLFNARLRLFLAQNSPLLITAPTFSSRSTDVQLQESDENSKGSPLTDVQASRISGCGEPSRTLNFGNLGAPSTRKAFNSTSISAATADSSTLDKGQRQHDIANDGDRHVATSGPVCSRRSEQPHPDTSSAHLVPSIPPTDQAAQGDTSPTTSLKYGRPASRNIMSPSERKDSGSHQRGDLDLPLEVPRADLCKESFPISSSIVASKSIPFNFLDHTSFSNNDGNSNTPTICGAAIESVAGNDQSARPPPHLLRGTIHKAAQESPRSTLADTQRTVRQHHLPNSTASHLANPPQAQKADMPPNSARLVPTVEDTQNLSLLYSQIFAQIPQHIQDTAARNAWVQSQVVKSLQNKSTNRTCTQLSLPCDAPSLGSPIQSLSRGTNLSGEGLTKKMIPQPQTEASQQLRSSLSYQTSSTTKGPQRKRSASVEITDDRPRRRRREEPDRVVTPPLNPKKQEIPIKNEPKSPNFRRGDFSEGVTASQSKQYKTTGQPRERLLYNIADGDNRSLQPNRPTPDSRPASTSWRPSPGADRIVHAPDAHGTTCNSLPRPRSESSPSDSFHRPSSRRFQKTGTPVLIAEARANTATVLPRTHRPRRKAACREPGSYKTPAYRPLSASGRRILELRYAANVAKIIITKICVSDAPLPLDTVPISIRLKQRFGRTDTERIQRPGSTQADEEDGEGRYRNAADFQADAIRMLRNYSELGHCENCPFLKTGNARVMCYRMRLASIVDDRMRHLPECLKACEFDCDADDQEAKFDVVDGWFNEDDFESAKHYQGP